MEDAIAKETRETSMKNLLSGFEQVMPAYWADVARPTIAGERAQIAWGHLATSIGTGYLRYASRRRRGLAIGRGVTEGACKSVITMRFKRSATGGSKRDFRHVCSSDLFI